MFTVSFTSEPNEFYRVDWYQGEAYGQSSHCYGTTELLQEINSVCGNPYTHCVWSIWDEEGDCWLHGDILYCEVWEQ